MPLPKAVREQAERAEAALQAAYGNTAPQATPAEPPVAPPVEAPAPAPAAPPIEAPAPTPPAPTPAPVAPPAADPWELKYRVLEGKYRAEVPRLAEQVRELTEKLNSMTAAPATPAAAGDQMTAAAAREQYGDDFTNAVAAVAGEQVKKVRDEFQSKVVGVEESVAQNARQNFFRELAAHVPDWQAIDAEAGFTTFLDEFDPLTGRTRREFFNAGDQANNAAQVAAFFGAYVRGRTPPAPPPAPPVPPPSVEHLIEPDSSRHSEAPPGKKLWNRTEVQQFYAGARAMPGQPFGRYTKAEYERISADIDAAISEGRMRG